MCLIVADFSHKPKIIGLLLGVIFLTGWVWNGAGLKLRSEESISITSWNLENYNLESSPVGSPKSLKSKVKIVEAIYQIKPDIILLQEVGGMDSLKDLVSRLSRKSAILDYPYAVIGNGVDIHLNTAILSQLPVIESSSNEELSFMHLGQMSRIQRGLLHCRVVLGAGKELEIINLHLKSRRPVAYLDQRIFREQEASEVRKWLNRRIKAQPDNLYVVGGDFNDHPNSKALKILKGHGYGALKDTAPNELNGDSRSSSRNVSWTYFFEPEQSYSTIDYLLVNRNAFQLVDRKATYIYAESGWGEASDHRPITMTLRLE